MHLLRVSPLFLLALTPLSAQPIIDLSAWTTNGSAKIQKIPGGRYRLWLTPNTEAQAGSAFTSNPVVFGPQHRFRAFFQFQMTNPVYQASDGMTFVLQTEGPTALGSNGGNLGYANGSNGTVPGITPSVAVEFDDYDNSPYDMNDNHVAILTGGIMNDQDPQTPYGVTNCQPTGGHGCMNNGDVWSVWIDYDGANLNVALADDSVRRPANLISYPIDIASLLGPGPVYVGFTAGCGLGSEDHYVMNVLFEAGS